MKVLERAVTKVNNFFKKPNNKNKIKFTLTNFKLPEADMERDIFLFTTINTSFNSYCIIYQLLPESFEFEDKDFWFIPVEFDFKEKYLQTNLNLNKNIKEQYGNKFHITAIYYIQVDDLNKTRELFEKVLAKKCFFYNTFLNITVDNAIYLYMNNKELSYHEVINHLIALIVITYTKNQDVLDNKSFLNLLFGLIKDSDYKYKLLRYISKTLDLDELKFEYDEFI
jgi:hypothetical protein